MDESDFSVVPPGKTIKFGKNELISLLLMHSILKGSQQTVFKFFTLEDFVNSITLEASRQKLIF